MIARDLISDIIRPIDYNETGEKALLKMHDYNVSQLPVVENEKYMGMISFDEIVSLKHLDEPIKEVHQKLKKPYTHETSHLFEVMKSAIEYNVKVVPVLSDETEKYLGIISAEGCMRAFASLNSILDEGAVLELVIPLKDYQLSEIARIAESEDAKILALYTQLDSLTSKVSVTVKFNTSDLATIIASYERYEYEVKATYQETEYAEDVKERYDSFMKFMNV